MWRYADLGTASVGADGETLFPGDFRAQTRRTFANIAALLESEGATWKDVVRTTCYLRDIERDYAAFNEERTAFYGDRELDPLPLPPASRRSCAVPTCWWRSKHRDLPHRWRQEGVAMSLPILRVLMAAAAAVVLQAQTPGVCSCGAKPARPPKDREVRPYATRLKICGPTAISPRLRRVLSEAGGVQRRGADVPTVKPQDVDEVRIGFLGRSRTTLTRRWAA